jgi:hypothetical protein
MLRRLFHRPPPRPVQVDGDARKRIAILIRRLICRRIDNFEFDRAAVQIVEDSSGDPAISDAFEWCWSGYDDFRRHYLDHISPEQRRQAARLILFLRGDLPYCWIDNPVSSGRIGWVGVLIDAILNVFVGLKVPIIVVCSLILRVLVFYTPRYVAPQEPEMAAREGIWPFASVADLDRRLTSPVFLAG